MEWLVIGLFVGVIIGYKIKSSKTRSGNENEDSKKGQTPSKQLKMQGSAYPPIGTLNKPCDGHTTEELNTPIEILPNLYSVSLSNVSIKHKVTYDNGVKKYDYITLKCRVNYKLNGRKEGKRRIVFTSYDGKDGVQQIINDQKVYRFTDAGCEVVELRFNDCDKNFPSKFSVSIQELPDGRYV